MWTLALALSLLLATTAQAATGAVLPQFACWYPSFEGSVRHTNLVFSYNNTDALDTILPLGAGSNQITPASLDGAQDDVLKAGYHPFALVLANADSALESGAVAWALQDRVASVDAAQASDPGTRCDTAYAGACPNWVDGFCQDATYCNGVETCFTVSMFGAQSTRTMGVCVPPSGGVACTAPQRCSESALRCVTPATGAPTAAPTAPGPDIFPLFFCWFYTQEAQLGQVVNLALGYSSTANGPLARPVTQSAAPSDACNNLAPAGYNGQQTTQFQAGYDPLAFTVKDLAGALQQPGGEMVWSLTRQTLRVGAAQLTPERECAFVSQPGDSAPPPGDEDVSDEVVQCSESNTTCADFDTFCHGPTVCNVSTEQCDPVDPTYNPCLGLQAQVSDGSPVVLECVEHLQLCVAYVNCTSNAECNDGVFCNGQEYCSNGTCYGQANLTIEKLCGTVNAYCEEGENGDGRCVATNQSINQRTVTGIVAGSALILVILGLGIYFFFMRASGSARQGKSGKTK